MMLSERINQLIGTLEEAWEQHHFKAFLLALRKLMDELQVEHHGLLQQEPSDSVGEFDLLPIWQKINTESSKLGYVTETSSGPHDPQDHPTRRSSCFFPTRSRYAFSR